MPDLTKAFSRAYDGIRSVTQARRSNLRLLDGDGAEMATVQRGWLFDEVRGEHLGERVIELRITDRTGIEFADVVFFVFGGYQYERAGFANPPAGNPREWVWVIKPVGTDPDTE